MKIFPGVKARSNHTISVLEDSIYDAAAIRVGINDLPSNVKSTNEICKDTIDIELMCRTDNIDMIFISSIAHSSKAHSASIQHLNGFLFDECERNGFNFADSESVSEIDLCTDVIRLIENGS